MEALGAKWKFSYMTFHQLYHGTCPNLFDLSLDWNGLQSWVGLEWNWILNNLSLNSKKMQFNSTDCKFFRHRLTPDGIKVDPKKIEAIIQMDPPQNIASLQSFNGMVDHLKKFSPVLSELSGPLSRLCKSGVEWAWESEQQNAFKAIKQVITALPV